MKQKDTIDLYDDEGKLLKSNVTLDKISPLVNKGALNVIDLTKRTVAVNLAGIEEALKTGKFGGKSNQILGRSMNCSVVKDCDALSAKIKDMVQVTDGDNTKITKIGGGKMILVEVPTPVWMQQQPTMRHRPLLRQPPPMHWLTSTRSTCSTVPMSRVQSGVPTRRL